MSGADPLRIEIADELKRLGAQCLEAYLVPPQDAQLKSDALAIANGFALGTAMRLLDRLGLLDPVADDEDARRAPIRLRDTVSIKDPAAVARVEAALADFTRALRRPAEPPTVTVTITLNLDAQCAAGLKRFAEKISHEQAMAVLYAHKPAELRSEQASQILMAFGVLEHALADAGVRSWPWVETARVLR